MWRLAVVCVLVLGLPRIGHAQEDAIARDGETEAVSETDGETASETAADGELVTPTPTPPVGEVRAERMGEGVEETEVAAQAEEDENDLTRFLNGFHFGSYGRVVAASDLAGRTGRQSRLVSFAPRIDEDDTYAEMELRREDTMFGVDTRIVFTIAYGGPLFHYDGNFNERIAVRNLFVEARNILTRGFSIWAGSRMVRGDDIYLMNFWPLDNLNMVGGGFGYDFEDHMEFRLQVGMSQPNNPFQQQTALLPARVGFLPDEIYILDRPRIVLSGRITWWPFGRFETTGMSVRAYGEQHFLAGGDRTREDGTVEHLPEDSGYVLGGQVGGYLGDSHAFANLFFRYARGLGAYDPLGVPFRTGTVIQTGRAEEIRVALSANYEWRDNPDIGFGIQLGGWWRLFRDADPSVFNRSTLSEGAISARPMVWFGDVAGIAVDLSYQGLQTTTLDVTTGRPEGGGAFKFGLMPFVSPWGRGTYTRPQIRLVYVVTARDDGARALYNDADPRSQQPVEHFLGVSVEWWFSSSSYGN